MRQNGHMVSLRPMRHPAPILVALGAATLCGAVSATPLRLEIDPARSSVGFLMRTTWHDVEGRTSALSGDVTSDSGDIFTDGRVSVEIQAASLDTGNGRRDRTMREEHLETAGYPTITFLSTAPPAIVRAEKDSDGSYRGVSFTVAGDLTIHGLTRRVLLPAAARRDGAAWEITGELPVRLSDHGIPDPSIMFNKVQDEVTISFTVRTREAAVPPSRD